MKYIKGQTREQTFLFPVSMDASISNENEVRVIDLFVESLNLKDFGFKVDFVENGRPAYHPSDLLKLYIYGYMNKVRSSRDLEKECKRNIEVMWLLKALQPDHNTISVFRKDNSDAIRKVFQATVKIAKHFNLLGNKLLAGDSTKLRAQNSKKNNYNQGKINRHIEYIDKKIEEYNAVLSKEDCDKPEEIKKTIAKHVARKEEYLKLEKQLNESGQEQISTSDTESRQMITRNNITEVAYNVQTTVDAENCLIIDYKVTNNNDSKAMGEMLTRAAEIVGNTDFTALYDKGYHTGSEFKKAQELEIKTLVAIPDPASGAPDPNYNVANFKYNKEDNTYTCPQGHTLKTNGTWNIKKRGKHQTQNKAQQFKTKECKNCPVKTQCTKNKDGRVLERSEYADYVEQNRINIESDPKLYKRRQSIVEHPYGTIKRQWGFYYIMTKKSMKRASADVGFIFIAYNLRRIMNILGLNGLKELFKALILDIFKIICFVKLFFAKKNNEKIFLEHFILNLSFKTNCRYSSF